MIWLVFFKRFRPGWHPWLWMLVVGTCVTALVNGAVFVGLLLLWVAVWMVRR